MARSQGKRSDSADRPSRGPGRPSGEPAAAVRRRLLDSARALCIETGLDAATSKAIAARAGVNPAMINYYFGSKEGLGRAMMLESMRPILAQLEAAGAGAGGLSIASFMSGYMRALVHNPWLPQLVVREVLPANGRFRALFFDELAAQAGSLLSGLVGRSCRAGQIPPGIDESLLPVSIASLIVFPFLAAPVLERVLGVEPFDPATADRLAAHSIAVIEQVMGAEVHG